MSNTNIANMNDKQLRNEVQLLRDELAIFKRKYEDLLYNLDDDNFSSRFVKEKGDMKTAIEITAEGIKTKVSNEEFESAMSQTAEEFRTEVSNLSGTLSSQITQTANKISTRVTNLENFKTSVFTQTDDGFYLDGDVTKFTGVLYLTDDNFNDKASLYYGDGTDDMHQEYIAFWPIDYSMPMVFGYNAEKVYISSIANGNQIATRGWVLENAGGGSGGVARFG